MDALRVARRAAPILLVAALLTACSSEGDSASGAGTGRASASAAGRAAASATPDGSGSGGATASPGAPAPSASETATYPTSQGAPGAAVPEVRDAFAVLQATYNDGCTTPGNCEYFLTRVVTNLDDLYNSMKASPKGTGHFGPPLSRIKAMQEALAGDFSFPNLKRHQKLLLSTRDDVNTWMQSHPEDYR
ncbi:hypothetical protein ABZ484_23325 [Streptomyces sp. NPDC006393]|uniref:hypothetical protein n=1 Tax=Streptomyces sp. NPDC006393 TaxID=3156763 RepID=UPI00340EB0B4